MSVLKEGLTGSFSVMPAIAPRVQRSREIRTSLCSKAGIQDIKRFLDSRLRGNDVLPGFREAVRGPDVFGRVVSERAFFGVSALLFTASAALTILWCASMSTMSGMPMPGGWTMSMTWMRMPGQTWPGLLMLWRYRQAVAESDARRLGWLTVLVGAGYFFVWTLFGIAAFPLGVALAAVEMQQPALARAVPFAVGVIVLISGTLQFSTWKAHHLACCRAAPGRSRLLPADAGTAWRHGLRLGLHCSYCCASLTAILLAIGVMDLRAMTVVTAAITVERLAPNGERVARATGAVAVGTGLFLIARAAGFA